MATIERNAWHRASDELAVRVEADEVARSLLRLSRPLVIEHGTRAVVFHAGRSAGEVPAGRYDMAGDLPGFLRAANLFTNDQRVSAVLMDAGVFGLPFGPYLTQTADDEQIRVGGRLALRVSDPNALVVNVLKGSRRIVLGPVTAGSDGQTVSLSARLADAMRMCIGGLVRRLDAAQLDDAWWASDDLGNRLRAAAGGALAEAGIELVRVDSLDVSSDRLTAERKRRTAERHAAEDAAAAAARQAASADLDAATRDADRAVGRRDLAGDRADADLDFDRRRAEAEQALRERSAGHREADQARTVDHDRRRADAEQDLRERSATNKEAERSRGLAHERGRTDVAAEADAADLAGRRAEVERARSAVAATLRQLAADGKLDQLRTEGAFTEAVRKAEHEAGLVEVIRSDEMDRLRERFEHDHDLAAIARRIEVEGITDKAGRSRAWDALLEDERRKDELRHRDAARQLAATHDQLERRRLEIDLRRLDHEQQLSEREREARLKAQLRSADLDIEDREQDQQFRKAARAQELLAEVKRMEQAEDDAAHRRDLERASAERTDRLEQMRLKAGLTPDQILAMTAEQNPAAAEALAERYKADGRLSREREQWLREQLDDQRRREQAERDRGERSAQQQRADHDANTDRLLRLMGEQRGVVESALEQMGHVAANAGRPVAPPPSAYAPPPPPPPTPSAQYHVHLNGRQAGPYDLHALRGQIAAGQVIRSTLVWRDGLSQWQSADQVPEVAPLFGAVPPPPPTM